MCRTSAQSPSSLFKVVLQLIPLINETSEDQHEPVGQPLATRTRHLALIGDEHLNPGVRVLRILGRGGQAGANGPDRLVGDHHLRRVQQLIDLGQLHVHLSEDNLQPLLADLLPLADAEARAHARVVGT